MLDFPTYDVCYDHKIDAIYYDIIDRKGKLESDLYEMDMIEDYSDDFWVKVGVIQGYENTLYIIGYHLRSY